MRPFFAAALLVLPFAAAFGDEKQGSTTTSEPESKTSDSNAKADAMKVGQDRAETLKPLLRGGRGQGRPMPEALIQALGQMDPERFEKDVLAVLKNKQMDEKGQKTGYRDLRMLVDPGFNPFVWNDGLPSGQKPAGGESVSGISRHARAQAIKDHDSDTLRLVPPEHHAYDKSQNILATKEQLNGNHSGALRGYEGVISRGNAGPDTYALASLSALNLGEPRKALTYSLKSLEMDPAGPMAEQATAVNKMASKRVPKEEDPKAPIRGSDPHEPSAPARGPAPTKAAAAAASIPELDRPLQPRAATAGLPPEALAVVADTNRLMALASKAYRANDLKEALKLSAETLAKDPDDVRALQVSAAAHAKEGKWEEVRKEADKGLDLAPGYVPLLLLRSASAIHVKDWRAAKADAAAVLAKEKANPTAWRFMGIAQSGLGEREESVTSLSRAQQYGDPEARRLLALARSLPPGADAADLVEMLANAADGLETAAAARAAAAPPPARGLKTAVVFAAAVMTGIVVGGLIFLAGRPETESS